MARGGPRCPRRSSPRSAPPASSLSARCSAPPSTTSATPAGTTALARGRGGVFWGGVTPCQTTTQVSGRGGWASFGPLVQTMYEARRTAIGRMTAECAALGGHGVVGVSLDIGPFPAGGLEFKAIGTAVRAPGAVYPKAPFTSHLTGQDFAKLIMTGWVPAALVLGISIGSRHDDWRTMGQTRLGRGQYRDHRIHRPGELRRRHDARVQLEKDARAHGADAVVTSRMESADAGA